MLKSIILLLTITALAACKNHEIQENDSETKQAGTTEHTLSPTLRVSSGATKVTKSLLGLDEDADESKELAALILRVEDKAAGVALHLLNYADDPEQLKQIPAGCEELYTDFREYPRQDAHVLTNEEITVRIANMYNS